MLADRAPDARGSFSSRDVWAGLRTAATIAPVRDPPAGAPRPDAPDLPDPGRDVRERITLLWFAIAAGVFTLILGLQRAVNDDDVCTLHAIWMFANGHLPYRDVFYYRPPSLLILLSPLAWIATTPSVLFLCGRLLIAVAAGCSLYWVGRIVRAKPHLVFLTALAWLLFLLGTAFYIFRAEYLAAALFFLHLFLLGGANPGRARPARSFAAALVLGLAATTSIRPLVLLPVQPLWILSRRKEGRVKSELALWVSGLLAGFTPSLLYLGAHHLWSDAFFWCFRLATFAEVTRWPPRLGPAEFAVPAVGLLALIVVLRVRSRGVPLQTLLTAAFVATAAFHFVNPHRGSFTSVHLYGLVAILIAMASVALVERIVPATTARGRRLVAAFGAAAVLAVAAALLGLTAQRPLRFDRGYQRSQLVVLDWLHRVAGREAVVMVAPHHTMVNPDATDLYDSFQYAYWIRLDPVRLRLAGFADSLERRAPAVISHDPWFELTGRRTLLEWLVARGVMTAAEATRARSFIEANYERVRVPRLAPGGHGSVFWIRKDLPIPRMPEL